MADAVDLGSQPGEAEGAAIEETSDLSQSGSPVSAPDGQYPSDIPAAKATPDDALRAAIKAAVDAGQWDRVRALTDILAGSR